MRTDDNIWNEEVIIIVEDNAFNDMHELRQIIFDQLIGGGYYTEDDIGPIIGYEGSEIYIDFICKL